MTMAPRKEASSGDKPAPAADIADRIQKYLQIASILVAAVWSLWLYLSYDKDRKALDLKGASLDNAQKALEVEQTKALAQTERESKTLNLQQQEISLRQQNLTLAQQKLAASVQGQQQNNLMEQQRLQIEGQKIGIQASAVDLQTQQIKLGEMGQTPIEQHYSLKARPVSGEAGVYRVVLSISVTNKSKKRSILLPQNYMGISER